MVCWITDQSRAARRRQATRSSTRRARRGRSSSDLHYRLDVNTLHRDEDADVARAQRDRPDHAAHHAPLFFDEYRRNRTTGSFILIDEATNDTVGAGMILGEPD